MRWEGDRTLCQFVGECVSCANRKSTFPSFSFWILFVSLSKIFIDDCTILLCNAVVETFLFIWILVLIDKTFFKDLFIWKVFFNIYSNFYYIYECEVIKHVPFRSFHKHLPQITQRFFPSNSSKAFVSNLMESTTNPNF